MVNSANEIECLTYVSHQDDFTSVSKKLGSPSLDSYKLPHFCDGGFRSISKFSNFVVLLTEINELFFYDKLNKEIYSFDKSKAFSSISTSKNRLLALDQGSNHLYLLISPLYGRVSFNALEKKIISLTPGDLVIHQLRLGQAIIFSPETKDFTDSITDISKKQKPETSSRKLVFEKSFVRMKYKEIRDRSKSPSDLSKTFTMNTELAKLAQLQQKAAGDASSDTENKRIDEEVNQSNKKIEKFRDQWHDRVYSRQSPHGSFYLPSEKSNPLASPIRHAKTMSLNPQVGIRIEEHHVTASKKSSESKQLVASCADEGKRGTVQAAIKLMLVNQAKNIHACQMILKTKNKITSKDHKLNKKKTSEETQYPDERNFPNIPISSNLTKQRKTIDDTFQLSSYTTMSPRAELQSKSKAEVILKSGGGDSKRKSIPQRIRTGGGTTSLTLLSSPSAFMQSNALIDDRNSELLVKKVASTDLIEVTGNKAEEEKGSNMQESKESVNIRSLGGSGLSSPNLDLFASKMRFIQEFVSQSQPDLKEQQEAEARLKRIYQDVAKKMNAEFTHMNEMMSPNSTIRETVAEDAPEEEKSSLQSSVMPANGLLGIGSKDKLVKHSAFEREKGYEIGPGGLMDFKKSSFDSTSKAASFHLAPGDLQSQFAKLSLNTESMSAKLLDPYLLRRSSLDQLSYNKSIQKNSERLSHKQVHGMEESAEPGVYHHHEDSADERPVAMRPSNERPSHSFVSRLTASPKRCANDELNQSKEIDPKMAERVLPKDLEKEITLARPLDKLKRLCNQDRSKSRKSRNTSEPQISREDSAKRVKINDTKLSRERSNSGTRNDSISIYDKSSRRAKKILSPSRSGIINEDYQNRPSNRRVKTGRMNISYTEGGALKQRRRSKNASSLVNQSTSEMAIYSAGLSELRQVCKKKFSKYCAHFMTNLKLMAESSIKRQSKMTFFSRELGHIVNKLVKERMKIFFSRICLSETKLTALKNIKTVLGLRDDLQKLKQHINNEDKPKRSGSKSLNVSSLDHTDQSLLNKTQVEIKTTERITSPPRKLPPRPKSGSRPDSASTSKSKSTKRKVVDINPKIKFFGWKTLGVARMYERGHIKMKVKQ